MSIQKPLQVFHRFFYFKNRNQTKPLQKTGGKPSFLLQNYIDLLPSNEFVKCVCKNLRQQTKGKVFNRNVFLLQTTTTHLFHSNKNKINKTTLNKKTKKDKITLKPTTVNHNSRNPKVEGGILKINESKSIDLKNALLASELISIEQKLDIQERGFSVVGGRLFIHQEQVISSPSLNKEEAFSLTHDQPLDSSFEEAILIEPEICKLGLNYAKRKLSQRKWIQEHYRMEKNIRDPSKKITESTAFKRTTLKKLSLLDPNLSPKAMHEKTRRYNQRMQEDGIATITLRRKGELKPTKKIHKRTKEGPGRYSSNKYEMTEIAFQTFTLLEEQKLLYASPKEISFFLTTGNKMEPQKRQKKHANRGVLERQLRSTTEGISKHLDKHIVRKGKPSSDSLSCEKGRNVFSKEEINLGQEFGVRLKEKIRRSEHQITLQLQARTLLKHNKGDIKAARAHHERILAEHKRQQKRGIIKNEGAWRQSAIDRGIELNGTLKILQEKQVPKDKKPDKKKRSTKNKQGKPPKKTFSNKKSPQKQTQSKPKPTTTSLADRKRNLQAIHEAIQTLPRREEISREMASRWLACYKDVMQIKNAIFAAYEQNKKGSKIGNLEAYITALIKKEIKPKNFNTKEHTMIGENKKFLKEKVSKLRSKGIGVTTSKIYREGRELYEIKLSRKKACGDFDFLEIAFYDPKLGDLINDFEKQHDQEKTNVPENQWWVDKAIKTLGEENLNLNIKETGGGYRLYLKTEQVIGEERRRFMDHIDLKLSKPKTTLEKDLQDFLSRNQLVGMNLKGKTSHES